MPLLVSRLHDFSVFNPIVEREVETELELLENDVHRYFIKKNATSRPKSFLDVVIGKSNVQAIDAEVPGDERLRDLRAALACIQFHKYQKIFIEAFVQSSLPKIYGEDFHDHEYRIRKENNIEYLYMYSLLCCSRRLGKTYTVAGFAACALMAIPNITITIFSPGKRQSGMMLEAIKAMVDKLKYEHGYKFEMKRGGNNKELFAIMKDGTERRIRALPGKPEVSFFLFLGWGERKKKRVSYIE